MGMIINVDGTVCEVKPQNGKYFGVPELRQYVEGDLEAVHLWIDGGGVMWVNEEGKLLGKEPNPWATWFARAFGTHFHLTPDVIVGVAVVLLPGEMEPEDYEEPEGEPEPEEDADE